MRTLYGAAALVGMCVLSAGAATPQSLAGQSQGWCPYCQDDYELDMHTNYGNGFYGNDGPTHEIYMPYQCSWTHPNWNFCEYQVLLEPVEESMRFAAERKSATAELLASILALEPRSLRFDLEIPEYFVMGCEGPTSIGFLSLEGLPHLAW